MRNPRGLKKTTNLSLCWRVSCFSPVLQTGRFINNRAPQVKPWAKLPRPLGPKSRTHMPTRPFLWHRNPAEPLTDSSTIGPAYPTQLRRQRLRISDWQFTSEVATNVGSRAPVNQIHPAQLRDLLSKPLFSGEQQYSARLIGSLGNP